MVISEPSLPQVTSVAGQVKNKNNKREYNYVNYRNSNNEKESNYVREKYSNNERGSNYAVVKK